jgi:hypothetical protein
MMPPPPILLRLTVSRPVRVVFRRPLTPFALCSLLLREAGRTPGVREGHEEKGGRGQHSTLGAATGLLNAPQ